MKKCIEKEIELSAPIERVWSALVDYIEFGRWFRVDLEGPFLVGQPAKGSITYPGYEHLKWQVLVHKMEPQKNFSFSWHPYAIDSQKDYSREYPTLVEFKLLRKGSGTILKLCESGFEQIPFERRDEAFYMNSAGWEKQLKNIKSYVEKEEFSMAIDAYM